MRNVEMLLWALETRDREALAGMLAPDAVLHGPVLSEPVVGREPVSDALHVVLHTFDAIEFTQGFSRDGATVLAFRTSIGDREADGVFLVRLNQGGLIGEIAGFLRPLAASMALEEGVGQAMLPTRPRLRRRAATGRP